MAGGSGGGLVARNQGTADRRLGVASSRCLHVQLFTTYLLPPRQIKDFKQLDGNTASFRLATSDPMGGVIDLVARASTVDPNIVTFDIKAHGGKRRRRKPRAGPPLPARAAELTAVHVACLVQARPTVPTGWVSPSTRRRRRASTASENGASCDPSLARDCQALTGSCPIVVSSQVRGLDEQQGQGPVLLDRGRRVGVRQGGAPAQGEVHL